MKSYLTLAYTAIAAVVVSGASNTQDWSYKPTTGGIYGPSDWSKAAGSSCAGKRQSPIDIIQQTSDDSYNTPRVSPLIFAGNCDNYNVTQQYEAFKHEAVQSTCTVTIPDKTSYSYLQSHLHLPSEHTLNGKHFDGELHLVHKSETGLLVIGLFLQESNGNTPTSPLLAKLVSGLDKVTPDTSASLSLGSYGPMVQSSLKGGRVFNYPGSLTTPACTESVDWWVIETPVAICSADLAALRKQLQRVQALDQGRGARPVQPLNGRTITVY